MFDRNISSASRPRLFLPILSAEQTLVDLEYLVPLGARILQSAPNLLNELLLDLRGVLLRIAIPLQDRLVGNIILRVELLNIMERKFLQTFCLPNYLCSLFQIECTLGLEHRLASPVPLGCLREGARRLSRVSESISIILDSEAHDIIWKFEHARNITNLEFVRIRRLTLNLDSLVEVDDVAQHLRLQGER